MFKEDLADKQLWQERIHEWNLSGLSMAKWCRQHNCSYKAFQHRKAKYQKQPLVSALTVTSSSFAEILDDKQSSRIELQVNNVTVYLRKGFDPELLKSILQILRSI